MIQEFLNLEIKTNGLNLYEINDKIINWIKLSKFKNGILNISRKMQTQMSKVI